MTNTPDANLERYARQSRFGPVGDAGQRALAASRVLVCGCGALGSVLANTLARAGVGHLRIVDRDFLELNNLQRQVLYDEADVAAAVPKAIAAAEKLRRINSQIVVEPLVVDVEPSNVLALLEGVDLIVDGTDNFETRFLLNDAAQRLGIPWVYGGCLGAEGQTMTIVPGQTPCLRCLIGEPPAPGTSPTCDTAGILGPIINVIASVQSAEAIKLLTGNSAAISRSLLVIDVWENRWRPINIEALRQSPCPACRGEEFPWLDGKRGSHSAVLCGRNSVQLSFPEQSAIPLAVLADKLREVGQVSVNPFLLRLTVDRFQITVFPDGRAIIKGTEDVSEARSLYARYVGN